MIVQRISSVLLLMFSFEFHLIVQRVSSLCLFLMFSFALDLIVQRVSPFCVFDVFVCIGFDCSTCFSCFVFDVFVCIVFDCSSCFLCFVLLMLLFKALVQSSTLLLLLSLQFIRSHVQLSRSRWTERWKDHCQHAAASCTKDLSRHLPCLHVG